MKSFRTFTCCIGLFFLFNSVVAQTVASPKDIELKRIDNQKSNKQFNAEILNVLDFKVDDFGLLEKEFSNVEKELSTYFKVQSIELNRNQQTLHVVYSLVSATTDRFIEILDGVLAPHAIYLADYKEYLSL